jgi:hypothetical protein
MEEMHMEGTMPTVSTAGTPTTQEPTIVAPVERFAGVRVFEVSNDEYLKLLRGSKKWDRWNKYFENTDKGSTAHKIKRYLYKNPSKTIILKNTTTQDMVYFKPKGKTEA